MKTITAPSQSPRLPINAGEILVKTENHSEMGGIVLKIPCSPEARAWYIWASRRGVHYGKPFAEFCRQALENELRKIAAQHIKSGGKIPQNLGEYLANNHSKAL